MPFDLEGLVLWVHKEILEEMDHPHRLKFWFEPLEWCYVNLEAVSNRKVEDCPSV